MFSTTTARIVSSVPGRLRIRDCSLKNPEQIEELGAALASLDCSCSYQANPTAGSLTLFYDAGQYPRMENAVANMLGIAPANATTPANPVAVSDPEKRRRLSRQANRYAKYVMLASLGISLALAARGSKYGHALTGAVFVSALAVHLAKHRKRLLS